MTNIPPDSEYYKELFNTPDPHIQVESNAEEVSFEFSSGAHIILSRDQVSLLHTAINILIQSGWTGQTLLNDIKFKIPLSKIKQLRDKYLEGGA